ncbi:unnamed protein product [Lactuca saligna]|uniref:Uncharacterized protein n=1 Tax=Lactuca saligna TaxID=75948 RepID=A0AA35YS69_LACSI|nr:unnamed protein product [Lactuca saligna]
MTLFIHIKLGQFLRTVTDVSLVSLGYCSLGWLVDVSLFLSCVFFNLLNPTVYVPQSLETLNSSLPEPASATPTLPYFPLVYRPEDSSATTPSQFPPPLLSVVSQLNDLMTCGGDVGLLHQEKRFGKWFADGRDEESTARINVQGSKASEKIYLKEMNVFLTQPNEE